MSNYNPDAPWVYGQEFVGIRNEGLALSNAADTVEYGYTTTLAAARAVQDARLYMDAPYWTLETGQYLSVNVYPAGTEALSGPIRTLQVPLSALGNSLTIGGTAGDFAIKVDGASIAAGSVTSAQLARALEAPNSGNIISIFPAALTGINEVNLTFDMPTYLPQMLGKRVLGLNLLLRFTDPTGNADLQSDTMGGTFAAFTQAGGGGLLHNDFVLHSSDAIQRIKLPAVNLYWQNGAAVGPEAQPWTPTQLNNFSSTATAANKYTTHLFRQFIVTPSGTSTQVFPYFLDFVALEIVYCEEQRVATGTIFNSSLRIQPYGAQVIPLRALDGTVNPVLAAGAYTVTTSAPYVQSISGGYNTVDFPLLPPLNALRQLYALSSLTAKQVTKPFPPEGSVNQTFSATTVEVIPQLSLHVTGTGAPIPESQVYGRQLALPVYGSVTPIYSMKNDALGVNILFPQTRFYARRFGSTVVPLQMANGSAVVSITPAAFDLLPEIIDGWKEVNLRFTTVPLMGGTGGAFNWTWSATGENAGSRWEVLGVDAPAVSGLGGNALSMVPAGQRLDTATYVAPTGDQAFLTWISPPASGTGADTSADAVLLFSQDPTTIAGLAVAQVAQTLSTAVSCAQPPDGIATSLTYNRVTWTSPGVTGSGFGYVELQRSDAYDGTWQTVMLTTSPAVTGFSDYEARIGIQSSYRVRLANAVGFLGAFSTVATGTIAVPGVGGRRVTNSVLTFTTNERQSGLHNMAYVAAVDSTVEDLTFLEAGRVALQWMYHKDFQTAFQPTERGGEQFSRNLLAQQMTVAGPLLQQGFRGLRDLAWDTVTYVCVRNEIGDRWYANVQVPSGNFSRNRTLANVAVQVTETYTAPSVVDPAVQL